MRFQRLVAIPRLRSRTTLVGGLVLALSCEPLPTAPLHAPTPVGARASQFAAGDPADSPNTGSGTLDTDAQSGAGAPVLIGEYPMGTLTDITASGDVTLTWTPASGFSGEAGHMDPGGRRLGYYHDICTGYGEVALVQDGQRVAWRACSALGAGFKGRMLLQGSVTAVRATDSYVQIYNPPQHACGYPNLGWPGDCVTYAGTQTVTVTRVPADLTLEASSGGQPLSDGATIETGATVTFTAGRDPDLGGLMPWAILRWRFDAAPPPDGTPAPDPAPEPRTKACATISSTCTMAIYESGTLTLEGMPNGQKQARTFKVSVARAEATLSLDAQPKEGARGVSVLFTPSASDGSTPSVQSWEWTSDAPKSTDKTRACEGSPATCTQQIFESGRMTVNAVVGGVLQHASAPVKILPLTVEIVSVATQLDDESFTSLGDERTVRLGAKVSDPSRAGDVKWEVKDDPADQSSSGQLATPAPGENTTLTVVAPQAPDAAGPARWQLRDHPGELAQKQLAHVVRAYVVTDGDTTWSKERHLVQKEKDVLRQEYVDWKVHVPDRDDLGADFHTDHFSTNDLNDGDYTVFLATAGMRTGIEAFRTEMQTRFEDARLVFSGLPVNGGYRDPVHHHLHAGARALDSQHLHGNAIDFNITSFRKPAAWIFEEMRSAAREDTVDGCYEPASVVRASSPSRTLDHFHLDFRAAADCPATWRQ